MKYILLAAILWLHTSLSFAQVSCGTDATDQALRASNPAYDALRQQADILMSNASVAANQQAGNGSSALVVGGIHYIPVVVHVIHSGEAVGTTENPSDQTIINYIDMLNQAFAGTYPGYPGPGTGGQNIGIQFVLAQRAPDCSPTNGIVRRNALDWLTPDEDMVWMQFGVNQSTMFPFGVGYDKIAAMSNWPNLDYYNIYMVRKITGANFAFYPTGASTIYDASVLSMLAVTGTAVSPYVVTHEMGHGFGLRHTFEGSSGGTCPPNANCLTDGDMICDTDPHADNLPCSPTAINSCTGQPYGNIGTNYMCGLCGADRFTAGQKAYMHNVLSTLRWTLDTSLGGTSLALVPPTPSSNTPTITISTPQTTYCINSPVFFTASTTYAGANPVYQWKVNGVNAGSNSALFGTTTLNNGDVVTCELTSSYSPTCVSTNTAVSNSIQITVNNVQAPSVTISTPATVCSGYQATITATAFNTGWALPFFEWYKNGFPTGTGSYNSSYSYFPASGDVITCRMVANTSCTVSPYFWSNPVTVNVAPSSGPTITISATDTAVCSGSTITLNATYTNAGTTPPTINWMVVNNVNMLGTGPSLSVPIDTSCIITAAVIASSTGGLCYQNVAFSNWLYITADTPVTATVAISATDTVFCHGSSVDFAAVSNNGGVSPLYDWQVNGVSAGVSSATFSHVPDDNDLVSCVLHSSAACLTTNPILSNAITVHEFDTVAAQLTLLQGGASMCEGDTIVIVASYANLDTNTIITRQWLVNSTLASNSDTLMHIVVPGDNEIVLTTGFQYIPHCMTAEVAEYFRDTVTGIPLPAPPVITDLGTHLGSSYPDGQNQWYEVSSGMLTGETDQLFYPTATGYFYAVATVNGCSSQASDTVYIVISSVGELQPHEQGFYPNPSQTGRFFTPVQLVGREATITNSVGAVVQQGALGEQVSLHDVASGVYFLRVIDSNTSRSYRLVISR